MSVVDCTNWTCGQCCVLCMWVVESNIVIGLYVLDMWSVLCVMYVGWDLNIVIGLNIQHVVTCVCGWYLI